MKIKKGDKLTLVGIERNSSKEIDKLIFQTVAGNIIEFFADGEEHAYHSIGARTIEQKKFEEELEIS